MRQSETFISARQQQMADSEDEPSVVYSVVMPGLPCRGLVEHHTTHCTAILLDNQGEPVFRLRLQAGQVDEALRLVRTYVGAC